MIPIQQQPVIETDQKQLNFGQATVAWRTFFAALLLTTNIGGITIWQLGNRAMGWHTAAPTVGAWTRGSMLWNSAATVGQPIGWMCSVSGAPGTWIALAVL